eukprot:jgi/Botrbrau1/16470/Bobra.0142s0064.1
MSSTSECGSPRSKAKKLGFSGCKWLVVLVTIKVLVVVFISSTLCHHPKDSQKSSVVMVDFYGEALCPDCAAFVLNILAPLLEEGLQEIMQVNYVGWGNAKNTSSGVECQHGPQECYMNRILNCGVIYSPKRDVFYSLLICFSHYGRAMHEYVETCATAAGLDHANLEACAKGSQGDQLEVAAADATFKLIPKHSFVPWILVNGIPLGADCGNVKAYICAAYRGPRPHECYAQPVLKSCPGAP